MKSNEFECNNMLKRLAFSRPVAFAELKGRAEYSDVVGQVCFYDFDDITVIAVTIHNLPATQTGIFGFHIHENGACEGDYSSAGGHFGDGSHPEHAGDMSPIFSAGGNGFLTFATDRFQISDVVDKSVILHVSRDDFSSQPSGDSGARIACGIIEKIKK